MRVRVRKGKLEICSILANFIFYLITFFIISVYKNTYELSEHLVTKGPLPAKAVPLICIDWLVNVVSTLHFTPAIQIQLMTTNAVWSGSSEMF